jgi:hypothetical protein
MWTLANRVMCPQTVPFIYQSVIMGLENDFQELEQDATGQGGNDGDNNANNACALPASPCHHSASNSQQQRQQRQD